MARVEIKSPVSGSIWMPAVGVGCEIFEGNCILTLEVMKMEVPIDAPCNGTLIEMRPQGDIVAEGDVIAVIESK